MFSKKMNIMVLTAVFICVSCLAFCKTFSHSLDEREADHWIGYEVQIPDGWKYVDYIPPDLDCIATSKDKRMFATIGHEILDFEMTMDEYIARLIPGEKEFKKELSKEGIKLQSKIRLKDVIINGQPWKKLFFRAKTDEFKQSDNICYFFLDKDVVYYINVTFLPRFSQETKKTAKKIVNSFRLIE